MAIAIQSSGESLADLILQKARLERVQVGWETALSIALAVTAIAAFLVFVFDFGVEEII